MITVLDSELAAALGPLVRLRGRLSVSPHVNTLCLAYHYGLALDKAQDQDAHGRIKLMDWNLDVSSPRFVPTLTGGDLTGFYMFYSTKEVATRLKNWKGGGGFYNSLPVTRYRQRYIFLRRTTSNEEFVASRKDRHINEVAAELFTDCASRQKPFIITDILGQAKAVARTVPKPKDIPIIYPESPLGNPYAANDDFALFVYSGPSTEYMARASNHFIALNIDELPLVEDDAYETHIIWHMPANSKPEDSLVVSRCLKRYHSRLFGAAKGGNEAEFEGMSKAIGLTLTARHPSFGSTVFCNASDFRKCLLDHHSDPPP